MKKQLIFISLFMLVVLFGGVTITEVNKQNNERAIAEAKIQIERDALDYQKEQDRLAAGEKALNKLRLNECLEIAEDSYWDYAELNGTGKRDDADGITMAQYKWDVAEKNKKADKDACYKKYSN